MTRTRADLGFDDGLEDFNPADWAIGTTAHARPDKDIARITAEATGFRSREAKPAEGAGSTGAGAPPTASPPRRRRTGRNAQFNLKARPETIESFCAVADARGWGLGETLEHAVRLLQQEYGPK